MGRHHTRKFLAKCYNHSGIWNIRIFKSANVYKRFKFINFGIKLK